MQTSDRVQICYIKVVKELQRLLPNAEDINDEAYLLELAVDYIRFHHAKC